MKSNINQNKGRIFVGLSGGVDSAVSLALLKKQGFKVTGVFIKAWTPPGYPCTWREDRRSAMRACAVLDVPFLTLDLEKEYKREVVDYMIEEYKLGRTPNPDVMCNKEIKFGHFLKWALNPAAGGGAQYVATGHYAQIKGDPCSEQRSPLILLEGRDKNKDQSYFLWTLKADELKHILFPVGDMQKEGVRKLARKFKLPQASRKDSQGLCFLGQVDMKEFLSSYIPQKKGDVLDEDGKVIGTHPGAYLFTIGERHGFTLKDKTPSDKPLYIVRKDIKSNTITVSKNKSGRESAGPIKLKEVNLISKLPNRGITCRLRYRQEKIPCKVEESEGNIILKISDEKETYAPGQSVVLYKGEECLGGGIIS